MKTRRFVTLVAMGWGLVGCDSTTPPYAKGSDARVDGDATALDGARPDVVSQSGSHQGDASPRLPDSDGGDAARADSSSADSAAANDATIDADAPAHDVRIDPDVFAIGDDTATTTSDGASESIAPAPDVASDMAVEASAPDGSGDVVSVPDGGVAGWMPALSPIAASSRHTCLTSTTGRLRCWGANDVFQLGIPNGGIAVGTEPGQMPPPDVRAVPDGVRVVQVVVGSEHTCVLGSDALVRCFGSNARGQLGNGVMGDIVGDDDAEMPPPPVPLGGPVRQIAAGSFHVCALLESGAVRCFGGNSLGELGVGNTHDVGDEAGEMPPADVPLPGVPVRVFAGGQSSCALMNDGQARCWGSNVGNLGNGSEDNVGDDPGEHPTVARFGQPVVHLAMASAHTCALLATGKVRCVGDNEHYQLGVLQRGHVGVSPEQLPPADSRFGDAHVVELAVGEWTTCVRTSAGAVRCLGSNYMGAAAGGDQHHVGDTEAELPPPDVALSSPVLGLAAGAFHVCTLPSAASVQCFGAGSSGQLGLGSMDDVGLAETPGSIAPVVVFPGE